MALWGTIVNAAAIIIGGFLGMLLPRISDSIKNTVMQGLGLAITVLSITMALKSNQIVIVIMSVVLGGIIGELMRIEARLGQLGDWLQAKLSKQSDAPLTGTSSISEGFVTTTLVYCIGAMAILGPLDSGLRHNHDILYTKSLLDGFLSIIFASTLGIGVVFSAVSVFVMQGTIALLATVIAMAFTQASLDAMIVQITAVGGILVIGVGINILQIKKINVANMLPALAIAAAAVPIQQWITAWLR
ncbi:hypothetical protein A8709_10025 [Paenibacillus pectinilyticus]|uniref:DUF554 domain-containing protein n=1 Tax=Paenibacillus pectinilyticus TaxID=512399 RepID=A0A1C1A5W6_9BACL|nr:DUF554 domain-containing protein [Paenibacillus pectinilyticus]OCT15948.1 hypothetical protein A8709_10025 [Paenibacillus pectinilyticus]